MPTDTVGKNRTSYMALRTRLLAKRKLAEARMVEARDALRHIDREIAALERAQRR